MVFSNIIGKKVKKLGGEIECIRRMLEEHGVNHTSQREEILGLFISEPNHYKPDELFKRLRCKGIGIATIYRTLELLQGCGIIKEISVGKERYYELKKGNSKSIYIHFKCCSCGKFYDYFDAEAAGELVNVVESAEHRMNVKVNDITIMVNGLCSSCKK